MEVEQTQFPLEMLPALRLQIRIITIQIHRLLQIMVVDVEDAWVYFPG